MLIGGNNNQIEYTGDYGPYLVPQQTWQFSDGVSWVKKNHTFKFGAQILRRQVNLFRPLQVRDSSTSSAMETAAQRVTKLPTCWPVG